MARDHPGDGDGWSARHPIAWHLLTALAAYLLYRYYAAERRPDRCEVTAR